MAATANYVRITKSSLTERWTCIKKKCFVLFLHSFIIGYVVLMMFRRVILSFCDCRHHCEKNIFCKVKVT